MSGKGRTKSQVKEVKGEKLHQSLDVHHKLPTVMVTETSCQTTFWGFHLGIRITDMLEPELVPGERHREHLTFCYIRIL